MKHYLKANSRGFAHHVLPVIFAVIFAVIGIAYIVATHAQSYDRYCNLESRSCYAITFYSPVESASGRCHYPHGHTAPPTATRICAQPGRTVAVNPKYIAYGTTLCIQGIGTRVAEDTGAAEYFEPNSARKHYQIPRHIDVFTVSQKYALQKAVSYHTVTRGPCGGPRQRVFTPWSGLLHVYGLGVFR